MKKNHMLNICLPAFIFIFSVTIYSQDILWGYINVKGDFVISPRFQGAYPFSEGLAIVKQNNKYGFINKKGESIIDIQYEDACHFSEGLAKVKKNNKYGFIDLNGTLIIPLEYDNVSPWFKEGISGVKVGDKWGVIDKFNNLIIKPEYEDIGFVSDGLISVKKNGKWGYIDNLGMVRIDCQYDYASSFTDGMAEIHDKNMIDIKYIDNTGEILFKTNLMYNKTGHFENGLSVIQGADKKYGYIDVRGKMAIYPKYDYAKSFNNGLAFVYESQYRKLSCINCSGQEIFSINDFRMNLSEETSILSFMNRYPSIDSFYNGLAYIRIQEKYGYINLQGKIVIKPQFVNALSFSEGLAAVAIDPKDKESLITIREELSD